MDNPGEQTLVVTIVIYPFAPTLCFQSQCVPLWNSYCISHHYSHENRLSVYTCPLICTEVDQSSVVKAAQRQHRNTTEIQSTNMSQHGQWNLGGAMYAQSKEVGIIWGIDWKGCSYITSIQKVIQLNPQVVLDQFLSLGITISEKLTVLTHSVIIG